MYLLACFLFSTQPRRTKKLLSCRKTAFSTLRWARTNSCSTASTSTPTRCSLRRTSRTRRRPPACYARRLRCLVTSARFAHVRRAASTWQLARRTKRSSVLLGRAHARVCATELSLSGRRAGRGRGEPVSLDSGAMMWTWPFFFVFHRFRCRRRCHFVRSSRVVQSVRSCQTQRNWFHSPSLW